jgi:eukaryotic-like serine/threonine-protein kinase
MLDGVTKASAPAPARVLGRYSLYGEIAAGGMATVHFGRLLGTAGFARTVAIKRLHPQYAKDPEFVSMFLDEARLAARIRHPNVTATLDVVATDGELFLVMEYIEGETLARLLNAARRANEPVPTPIVATILCGVLHGLHAAHEATNERGEPLAIVHRDVSPQNVLVGADGVARVLDFGIAKTAARVQTTKDGVVKGKLAYMAPEQVVGKVTRATDVFAASIVLWECLTGKRFNDAANDGEILAKILTADVEPPSTHAAGIAPELEAITMRGLARDPGARYLTARDMARALERASPQAPASEVGEWVERFARATLSKRAALVAGIERVSLSGIEVGTAPTEPAADTEVLLLAEAGSGGARSLSLETPTTSGAHRGTDPITELSTVSSGELVLPKALGSSRRKQRRALAVLGAVVGLGLFAAFALGRGARDADERDRALPDATRAVEAPSAPPIAVAPAPSSAPAPQPDATAAASASATASARSPKPHAPQCNPPYTTDAAGDRHYKHECLHH